MPFDIARIRRELQAAIAQAPLAHDLAVAVINDVFRVAGKPTPGDETWTAWAHMRRALWPEQISMLGHCLLFTSLRAETAALLPEFKTFSGHALEAFFKLVEPLTSEMIRSNAFRQEEFVRKWISVFGGSIAGESEQASARRLDSLDYRKTLDEFKRAEDARAAEKAKRLEAQRIAQEAAAAESAARGWRE